MMYGLYYASICGLAMLIWSLFRLWRRGYRIRYKPRRQWHITKTIWPYAEGYGTLFYLRGRKTIVDTGVPFEQAQQIVNVENERERQRSGWQWGR